MYELAYKPFDIFIDYDSICSKCLDSEFRTFLDTILENEYRFFLFSNQNNFSYDNSIQNFAIINNFDIYDIDEYEKMFMLGDHEQYRTLFISSNNEATKIATSFGISCIFLVNDYNQSNQPNLRNYPDHVLILNDLKELLVKREGGVKLFIETIWEKAKYYTTALYKKELKYFYDEAKTVDVYMVGRYFRSEDLRSYSHISTKLILAFKDEKEGAYASLIPNMNKMIAELDKTNVDYITSVPCKPSKNNRFEPIFYDDEKLISKKTELNLLRCTRDYDTQKNYKTKQDKARNVKGVFEVNDSIDVEGKTILIIDDILTTGSTALECASVLYDKGAKNVILLPFGVTQDTYDTMPKVPKIENAGETYKLRFTKSDGKPFWVAGKGNFENYDVIKESYLKQNDTENSCV